MMIGADTDELRAIARRFSAEAERLEGSGARTRSAVLNLEWAGADREAFVENWTTGVDAPMGRLGDELVRIGAIDLVAQADAQDDASGAHPSSAGSGTSRDLEGAFGSWWYASRTEVDDEERHVAYETETIMSEDFISPYEINQRAIGDCWVLAPLAAIAHEDPAFLSEHIVYDAATNEYIVTLYENGEPVEVRVANSVPVGEDGTSALGTLSDQGTLNYATVYEKAMAEHLGGDYGDIWGGNPSKAFEIITGEPADTSFVTLGLPWEASASADTIRESVENGEAVVLGTKPFLGSDSPIAAQHAYAVTEVRPNGDLVVYNPWGYNPASEYQAPGLDEGELLIPAADVDKYFSQVSTTG